MAFDSINCFQKFNSDLRGVKLPEKFTFPFVYEPSEIALIAANEDNLEVMNRLLTILNKPYDEQNDIESYQYPLNDKNYKTFCGT